MPGVDAKLISDGFGGWDINIDSNGDIESEDSLDTYILVCLFTDKRADASEVSISHKRRGWIGNEDTPGFEMGSKLWLLDQEKATNATAASAGAYASEALQQLVIDKLALSVKAVGILVHEGIRIEVTIQRTDSKVEVRYFNLWENTGD